MKHLSDIYSEKDEVDGIKWISFNDIDNYEWAFNHRDILETLKNTLAQQHKKQSKKNVSAKSKEIEIFHNCFI